jgi:ParB/Sulfiredoxin domain/Lrp/AsnC ligand binding domain
MKSTWLEKIRAAWAAFGRPDVATSFKADQQKELAFDTVSRGTRTVPLAQIVGSVGRYQDFDSQFRPMHHMASERYQNIKQALRQGHSLPPVKLYQIKDKYYVLDGNHRIAAAKELKHDDILATILEFIPSRETLENLLYAQRSRFSEMTGLAYAIALTEVGQYDHLLEQIAQHKEHLEKTLGGPKTLAEAASDWYETIYRPLVAIIRKGNLLRLFPQRTLDDLYAYISYHQWELGRKRKYGIGIDRLIPNNMEAFREKMANTCKAEYPEMLREITAFVLMNVVAKNEEAIMAKLFALKEVREIHSIHGDADVLAKVVLTRDLLSSDAEIISEFVHVQMRQIQGVVSTKTLIPGRSMIK